MFSLLLKYGLPVVLIAGGLYLYNQYILAPHRATFAAKVEALELQNVLNQQKLVEEINQATKKLTEKYQEQNKIYLEQLAIQTDEVIKKSEEIKASLDLAALQKKLEEDPDSVTLLVNDSTQKTLQQLEELLNE